MAAMKPYVKAWYDSLAEGRLMGMKCQCCGKYEFPYKPVCNHCGSTDLEEVEMSGKAKLLGFSRSVVGIPPYTEDPVTFAQVKMEEGPTFISWIPDIKSRDQEKVMEELPVDLTAEIVEIKEGISWPVFHVDK